jgi:hypothetical protein
VLASSYRIRMALSGGQLMRYLLALSVTLLAGCDDVYTIDHSMYEAPECGDVGWTPGCEAGQREGERLGRQWGLDCERPYPFYEGQAANLDALEAYCFPDGPEGPGPPCDDWTSGWSDCFYDARNAAYELGWAEAGCDETRDDAR